MNSRFILLLASSLSLQAASPFGISSLSPSGLLEMTNAFSNGVCIVERAETIDGSWKAARNVFSTSTVALASLLLTNGNGFYRAKAMDLSNGRAGFTNLTLAYGVLTTIAGAGGPQEVNNWQPQFEGAPGPSVVLSTPHMTMADRAGNYYIADKDANGIRKIRLDGTIVTVAGNNTAGNGADELTPGTQVALSLPNGLFVREDGTLYILDTGNGKVRRLGTNGMMKTMFTVPGGIQVGRGLWVNEDESVVYFCSFSVVKRWTADTGAVVFSTGYVELGNLTVDALGRLVVTDRGGHRVYRLDDQGGKTVIAGNGLTLGGGDGQLAINTALEEVRGIWCLPSGAFFVATHRSSRVWYVDASGFIHLFLHGIRNGLLAGDGTWFYNPTQARVSEVRAITMDYEGNLLITDNDAGYIRKVRFLPFEL